MEPNSLEIKLRHSLKGHKGPIYALCKGTQPNSVISAGADRQVIEWNLDSGEGRLLANAAATVMSLLYLEETGLLLIGQTEGGVHVIHLEEKKEIKYLKGHTSYIFDILYLPLKEELVFSSADGSISVWSSTTFERLYAHSYAQMKLRKMDLNQEGNAIALSRGDNCISLISTKDYVEKRRIETTASVNVSRFTPDGKYLLAGDKMAHLHKIRISDGEILSSLPAHYWAIYDICFSPTSNYFATASRDKIVKVWEAESMQVLQRLEGRKAEAHTHSVNSLYWEHENTLVSAGDDGLVRSWELKS